MSTVIKSSIKGLKITYLGSEKTKKQKPSRPRDYYSKYWNQQKKREFVKKMWFKEASIVIGKKQPKWFIDRLFGYVPSKFSRPVGFVNHAPLLYYPEGTTYPVILADLGVFSSRGEAWKNGYGKEKSIIPEGFSELRRTNIKKIEGSYIFFILKSI